MTKKPQQRRPKPGPKPGSPPGKKPRPNKDLRYPDVRYWPRRPDRPEKPPEKPIQPPKPGKWSKEIARWVKENEAEKQRERDECGRDRRKLRMPRPWLDCTSNFGPQILALSAGEAGTISFTVWNDGNFPAWSCYVEVYEGPGGYSSPLSSYQLRGRKIITLHPGQRVEVELTWLRQQNTGRCVGIVYDPLLDPKDFAVVEQYNRHITSIHYLNLE